jgi:hypothetical protein
MRYHLFLIPLFLCFTSPDNEVTLSWRDNLKLTWNDFKGEKNRETDAVAITASGISFAYSVRKANSRIIDFKAVVEAHFYPNRSWVKKELADDYILAHEQLHFDITELHVRKFRKQIHTVKVSERLGSVLDRLHQNINKDLATMQNQYDTESNNSINKEAQAKWILFVAKELKKYEAYKSRGESRY